MFGGSRRRRFYQVSRTRTNASPSYIQTPSPPRIGRRLLERRRWARARWGPPRARGRRGRRRRPRRRRTRAWAGSPRVARTPLGWRRQSIPSSVSRRRLASARSRARWPCRRRPWGAARTPPGGCRRPCRRRPRRGRAWGATSSSPPREEEEEEEEEEIAALVAREAAPGTDVRARRAVVRLAGERGDASARPGDDARARGVGGGSEARVGGRARGGRDRAGGGGSHRARAVGRRRGATLRSARSKRDATARREARPEERGAPRRGRASGGGPFSTARSTARAVRGGSRGVSPALGSVRSWPLAITPEPLRRCQVGIRLVPTGARWFFKV